LITRNIFIPESLSVSNCLLHDAHTDASQSLCDTVAALGTRSTRHCTWNARDARVTSGTVELTAFPPQFAC